MQTITAPETVALSKVQGFLRELGIDPTELVSLTLDVDGVYVELRALNEDGKPYFPTPGASEPAMHRIAMRLDVDA